MMNNEQEIWYKISGYPYAELTRNGQVRDLRKGEIKILTTYLFSGYPTVDLRTDNNDDRFKTVRIHNIMADMFLPPKPSDNHEVGHKDDNRINFSIDNLCWTLHNKNMQDASDRKRLNSVGWIYGDKDNSPNHKLTMDKVRIIRSQYEEGYSLARLAQKYFVSVTCIHKIITEQTWREFK
jgi:hypothetical protein